MYDIEVFLRVRIIDTGRLAAIGNFFLAPTRWFFSWGRTIRVNTISSGMLETIKSVEQEINTGSEKKLSSNQKKIMTGIAEVQSFTYGRVAEARHYTELKSTNSNYDYADIIVVPFLLIAMIPGMILGSIIKLLSYINNPIAQESHIFVKKMLTPVDKTIDLKESKEGFVEEKESSIKKAKPKVTESYLYKNLCNISVSGQHINVLSISGNTKLDDECAKIIHNLRPFKLILGEEVKAEARQFRGDNWDNDALRQPVFRHDYSGLGWECKGKNYLPFRVETRQKYEFKPMFQQQEKERDWTLSSSGEGSLFYYPPQKKVPSTTVVSSNQEALRHEPRSSHTVYVVRKN